VSVLGSMASCSLTDVNQGPCIHIQGYESPLTPDRAIASRIRAAKKQAITSHAATAVAGNGPMDPDSAVGMNCSSSASVDLAAGLVLTMATGGDNRIVVASADSFNEYFTCPRPMPDTIARASSTSSCVSHRGFSAAGRLFERLLAAEQEGHAAAGCDGAMESIHQRIKLFWGSESRACSFAITAPSGTDAAMLPTVAALVRHKRWQPNATYISPLVTNIVIASGEVGSNTETASGLRHFGGVSPIGKKQSVGEPIAGVAKGTIDVVGVKIRDDKGTLIPSDELEAHVATLLKRAIEQEGRVVVLQAVHACKTGVVAAPRASFLQRMKAVYNDSLLVVIDACQLRMDASAAGAWIDAGYWVALTGSKFLGGASFSGALLVPQCDAELLGATSASLFPLGLGDYVSRSNFDSIFASLRQALPTWHNVGLALRWETALAEGEWLHAVDSQHRDRGIHAWVCGVRELVQSSQRVFLLDDVILGAGDSEAHRSSLGKCNSIVCLGVRFNQGQAQEPMSQLQLRRVHRLMLQDLTDRIEGLSPAETAAAARRCHVGQPVLISDAPGCPCPAILRIAIGAPEMFKAIGREGVDLAALMGELLLDDALVVKKLELISEHWTVLGA
jgi:hypothetical protein